MRTTINQYLGKNYWINNTDFYKQPYFRLQKCARIVNSLVNGRQCDLLDVGCGPATLAEFLSPDIQYFGIDIAIHTPGPNFIELDIIENEIKFGNMRFDLIVAAGLFEYMGKFQQEKLFEINQLLKPGGKFVATYTNFNHVRMPAEHPPYNNIRPIKTFKLDLEKYFHIERFFPCSHNRVNRELRREWLKKIQMPLCFNIPIFSPLFAVNYFFICSPKPALSGGPSDQSEYSELSLI